MNWFVELLNMNNKAGYIWFCYLITAAVMTAIVLYPLFSKAMLKKRVQKQQRRDALLNQTEVSE